MGNKQICSHLFDSYTDVEISSRKRQVLRSDSLRFIDKINPLRYLAVGLMFVYQNGISEQISATCTYEVSCSETTKRSIAKYGLLKGTLIGLHQLSNCSRSALRDHEKHVITSERKIDNTIEYE